MRIRILLLTLSILLIRNPLPAVADDSILVSDQSSEMEAQQRIETILSEFVQQVIFYDLLKKSGDVVNRLNGQGNLKLLPSYAYLGSNQIVQQLLSQDTTSQEIRDIFSETFEMALDQKELGISPTDLQRNVKDKIDVKINDVLSGPIFEKIVELVIKKVYEEQTKFIARNMIARRAQMIAAQRAVMQQAIEQQYRQMIAAAYQQAVRRQVQQRVMNAAAQQRYQQVLAAYQQSIQQAYQQAVINSLSQ